LNGIDKTYFNQRYQKLNNVARKTPIRKSSEKKKRNSAAKNELIVEPAESESGYIPVVELAAHTISEEVTKDCVLSAVSHEKDRESFNCLAAASALPIPAETLVVAGADVFNPFVTKKTLTRTPTKVIS